MTSQPNFWFRYASPQAFYGLAGRLWPVFAVVATLLGAWGLWLGLFVGCGRDGLVLLSVGLGLLSDDSELFARGLGCCRIVL